MKCLASAGCLLPSLSLELRTGEGRHQQLYILLIDRLCEAEKERQSYILLSHSVNMNYHVEICFIACITYMAIILV